MIKQFSIHKINNNVLFSLSLSFSLPVVPSSNNGSADLESNPGLRTVIKIGTNSQSIEHHHHHIHHLGNGACVDTTPFMTPAQSVENFYQPSSSMLNQDNHSTVSGSIGGLVGGGTAALTEDFQNLEDDETLSVAGTEYSEAPSVARSYTISHSAQVSIYIYIP